MDADSGADSAFPGDAKQGGSAGTGHAASGQPSVPGLRVFKINDERFEFGQLIQLFVGLEELDECGCEDCDILIGLALSDLQAYGGAPTWLD